MKVLSFFSKFAAICNIAFVIFAVLNKLETKSSVAAANDTAQTLPFLKNIIITLGFSAIIINLIMCMTYSIFIIIGKKKLLPKWIVAFNFLLLIFQFYFFFF